MLCKFLLKKKSQEWNYIHVNIFFCNIGVLFKKHSKILIDIRVPFYKGFFENGPTRRGEHSQDQ